ncbi:MAG TPA: dTMP kinase [Polyangia bacterium]
MADGKLIVLEGIDGSGTTTQARLLTEWLRRQGAGAHLTREPSDGPVGRLIREILLGSHAPVAGDTMALLFAGDRADHLAREMLPQLAAGVHVITDRYYHSSLAYQALEADRAWVEELNRRARRPDVTFLLDVAAAEAERRRTAAGRPEERYDRLETQRRIAENYRELKSRLPGEDYRVLDGARPVEAVQAELRGAVAELCGLPPP